MRFFPTVASVMLLLVSCGQNKVNNESNESNESSAEELKFPYQEYFDNMGEDDDFPTIGNDGQGFNAISNNIVYPELPDSLSGSEYADSLLQLYNIILAFNTMAYDVGTAERYISEDGFKMEQADALDSINLSGIHIAEIRDLTRTISKKAAAILRKGKKPNEQGIREVEEYYNALGNFITPLYDAYLDEVEFDPATVMPDYSEIHSKVLTDTTATFMSELLDMVLKETDFQKQCILARELAYANHRSPERDDEQMVAVLDKLLTADKYSPLLRELWRMWRCMLQIEILSGRSNDSAMYNLFYNQMKNRVALVYIDHLSRNQGDKVAFYEFAGLAMSDNIVRNSGCLFGNNGLSEDMELFYSVSQPESEDDSES